MIFWGHPSKVWKSQQPSFLLAVEVELQQRTTKEKTQKTVKSSGRKGIRELRCLFSSVNYGLTSARHSGNGKEMALIISQ